MTRPTTILLLLLLLPLGGFLSAEPSLSKAGEKLLKHAIGMGRKRAPSKYDETRLAKMLDAASRDDLKIVAERLRTLPKAKPGHAALADRISARYWERLYPGSGAIPEFAKLLVAKTTPERAKLLGAALTLEDLGTARLLALETAAWKDPDARLSAVETLLALLDLASLDEKTEARLLEFLKDEDPRVRCVAAGGLDAGGRKEALDAYVGGLDDRAMKTVEVDGEETTFCFASQAFYRLAQLSKRHDAMEYAEFRDLTGEKRESVVRDLVSWWKEARARFSFNDSKWEKFAATPIVKAKVIDVSRPKDAFFRFRSPHDRSMVTLEVTHVGFVSAADGTWRVNWRLSAGVAGRRSGFDMVEARQVPANRRWGRPKQGIGRVSVAVQRIGEEKARVVIHFADFLGEK